MSIVPTDYTYVHTVATVLGLCSSHDVDDMLHDCTDSSP